MGLRDTGIEGPNHALLCGEICGALMKAGLDAQAVTTEGRTDYTNEIRITRPSGTYIVAVYPEEVEEP